MITAQELVDGLLAQPWGQVSPSVYETGRVVSFTPWLTGHEARVSFLLDSQRADGSWGVPDPGYALVPTLSAVEALLGEGPRAAAACERGLAFLRRHLSQPPPLPDMPAIEMIATSLVRAVNARIGDPLPLPGVLDDGRLELVEAAFVGGGPVPDKLWHALEVLGPKAAGLPHARRERTGTVGASPAATAAWLGRREPDRFDPARRFLETAVRQHGGPVPVGLPITTFERGWVLGWLARAGLDFAPHPELVCGLLETLGPDGAPTADGLPPDADTTSVALSALALLGRPTAPDALWGYETDTHFRTWPGGEDGRSITTNAHVLEAFGTYSRFRPEARYLSAVEKVANWLREQQCGEGHWSDRWHASPYYSTFCAALSLHEFGGEGAAEAVTRAVRWVLDTQREDGSWGIWGGTAEETSYAVQILALTGGVTGRERRAALRSGGRYLLCGGDGHPALWHDKDLYSPTAIVRASVLAATHLAGVSDGAEVLTG
ncbi:prenyltransferase/squalene oxidase repeat-containing protein [Actinocorallia libanotica]|uniref:Squalene cyclase C-terminal domain-containing protein n=1 Tax=Actinocorallia libanotica TaxID=46162 RepID=A0ABN1RDK1_9ACTN